MNLYKDYVWLGLGTNLGVYQHIIEGAYSRLEEISRSPLIKSPIYQTAPWGYLNQPNFLNLVIGIQPQVSPELFLKKLMEIEVRFQRTRDIRWGPRTLDLDILSWPNLTWSSPSLTLPHPRLHLRRFVLAPWCDIAPRYYIFGYQSTVQELFECCPDLSFISRFS